MWTISKNWITINEKVLKPLAENILIGLTASGLAADAGIHKS